MKQLVVWFVTVIKRRTKKTLSAVREFMLKLLFQGLKWIGIEAFVMKPSYHYAPDYFGRSAHKQPDIKTESLFGQRAAEVINTGRSALYYDRLYTIYQSLLYLKSVAGPGESINLVESGVYRGGTSYFIASVADDLALNITHHAFDTFEGHSEEDIDSNVEIKHRAKSFSNTSYADVKDFLSKYNNVLIYKGRFQDTCNNLDGQKIHFAHLDMDIYMPTLFALNYLDQILAPGGIMLLDDHRFKTCPGVEKALEEFMALHSNYFGISLLTGQYLLVKLIGR
jgi:hypothetical protein